VCLTGSPYFDRSARMHAGPCGASKFNTARARDYLVSYLDYYLGRPDLWFEQYEAMAALVYLDQRNGRQDVARVRGAWERFSHGRGPDLAEAVGTLATMERRLRERVHTVEAVAALLWPAS
jgi:hypothetical protein